MKIFYLNFSLSNNANSSPRKTPSRLGVYPRNINSYYYCFVAFNLNRAEISFYFKQENTIYQSIHNRPTRARVHKTKRAGEDLIKIDRGGLASLDSNKATRIYYYNILYIIYYTYTWHNTARDLWRIPTRDAEMSR